MSKELFSFKRFDVWQDRCAMKVGTDGVLIGAWAAGGKRILDVGTGTGLIAMMMAQRFDDACVEGIDIDADACRQAEKNVGKTEFAARISIVHTSMQEHKGSYDAIVSNPPFFENSLKTPDNRRTLARHTDMLPVADIFRCSRRMLADDGCLSVIIPVEMFVRYEEEAAIHGFFVSRLCRVKTVERKPAKRIMVTFTVTAPLTTEVEEHVLMDADGNRSEWYRHLTEKFYK